MSWTVVYLILAVLMAATGIWHLAQRRSLLLSVVAVLWVLVILLRFYFPSAYNFAVLPELGFAALLQYIAIPILLILTFLTTRRR